MCWHKWSKWEQYDGAFKYIPYDDSSKNFEYIKCMQKRKCKKCGYVQRKEVDY